MKVIKIDPPSGELVTMENSSHEPWNEFRRYSADNWEVRMGESWEMAYDCADLEDAYQAAVAEKLNG